MPENELETMLLRGVRSVQGGDGLHRMLESPVARRVQAMISVLPQSHGGGSDIARTIGYRVDAEYFYPASTIKLLSATCALRQLAIWRLARNAAEPHATTPVRIGDADKTTVTQEIQKIFLVSDNPAHNLLHDLVGHRELHEMAWAAGISSVRLRHRLSVIEPSERARKSPDITFEIQGTPCQIPQRSSTLSIPKESGQGLEVGRAHTDPSGLRHDRPMSFSEKNCISLQDLHTLTKLVFAPDVAPGGFGLERADLAMLMDAAALDAPPPLTHSHNKFLLPGLLRVRPREEWRVMNKVGRAYGFSLDTGVIEHLPTGTRWAFSATIYTNDSGELNTDRYDYARDADPFMADLGEVLGREMTP